MVLSDTSNQAYVELLDRLNAANRNRPLHIMFIVTGGDGFSNHNDQFDWLMDRYQNLRFSIAKVTAEAAVIEPRCLPFDVKLDVVWSIATFDTLGSLLDDPVVDLNVPAHLPAFQILLMNNMFSMYKIFGTSIFSPIERETGLLPTGLCVDGYRRSHRTGSQDPWWPQSWALLALMALELSVGQTFGLVLAQATCQVLD